MWSILVSALSERISCYDICSVTVHSFADVPSKSAKRSPTPILARPVSAPPEPPPRPPRTADSQHHPPAATFVSNSSSLAGFDESDGSDGRSAIPDASMLCRFTITETIRRSIASQEPVQVPLTVGRPVRSLRFRSLDERKFLDGLVERRGPGKPSVGNPSFFPLSRGDRVQLLSGIPEADVLVDGVDLLQFR